MSTIVKFLLLSYQLVENNQPIEETPIRFAVQMKHTLTKADLKYDSFKNLLRIQEYEHLMKNLSNFSRKIFFIQICIYELSKIYLY